MPSSFTPARRPPPSGSSAAAADAAAAGVQLTDEQRCAVAVAAAGYNVALVGPAGTGKTVALRAIIAELKRKCRGSQFVAVTATSGVAASRIGGITLHKAMGIQLGDKPLGLYVSRIRASKKLTAHWNNMVALIIEEFGMGTGGYLSKAEALARLVRGVDKPFGGIQVILCGDCLQLPPVGLDKRPDNTLLASRKDLVTMGYPADAAASAGAEPLSPEQEAAARAAKLTRFAFESPAWPRLISHVVSFTTIHRQRDPVYAAALNELRVGRIHPLFAKLASQSGGGGSGRPSRLPPMAAAAPGWELQPTTLFALKQEVREDNAAMLTRLGLPVWRITCQTQGDRKHAAELADQFMGERILELCVGAQVMLVRNSDVEPRLVNGTMGIVTRIACSAAPGAGRGGVLEDTLPDEPLPHMLRPVPAWYGRQQAADAAKSLAQASARAREEARRAVSCGNVAVTVAFTLHDGSRLTAVVDVATWERECDGKVVASVKQLPLQLAWATTIHKSQGATLPKLRADLRDCFDWSQVYVVMSRGCSLDAMHVINFHPRAVKVHPRALAFHTETVPRLALATARDFGTPAYVKRCEAAVASARASPSQSPALTSSSAHAHAHASVSAPAPVPGSFASRGKRRALSVGAAGAATTGVEPPRQEASPAMVLSWGGGGGGGGQHAHGTSSTFGAAGKRLRVA